MRNRRSGMRGLRPRLGALLALGLGLGPSALLQGCEGALPSRLWRQAPPAAPQPDVEAEVYRRAELERSEFYAREVERLRADLRQAEESIVAMESGLRGFQSRADAVSAVAEARIALERVSSRVPWRIDEVREAHDKLDEANRQLEADHVGSAMFFASRAQRITEALRAEVKQVSAWTEKRLVRSQRVNLRTGPSVENRVVAVLVAETPVFPERRHEGWTLVRTPTGQVGWIHADLLD